MCPDPTVGCGHPLTIQNAFRQSQIRNHLDTGPRKPNHHGHNTKQNPTTLLGEWTFLLYCLQKTASLNHALILIDAYLTDCGFFMYQQGCTPCFCVYTKHRTLFYFYFSFDVRFLSFYLSQTFIPLIGTHLDLTCLSLVYRVHHILGGFFSLFLLLGTGSLLECSSRSTVGVHTRLTHIPLDRTTRKQSRLVKIFESLRRHLPSVEDEAVAHELMRHAHTAIPRIGKTTRRIHWWGDANLSCQYSGRVSSDAATCTTRLGRWNCMAKERLDFPSFSQNLALGWQNPYTKSSTTRCTFLLSCFCTLPSAQMATRRRRSGCCWRIHA